MLASNDPAKLDEAARNVLQAMRGIELLRDPRIDGDLQRPEIIIRPRFDIAADLGVTTSALSQTIRIATIGDIEQNLAKFSLRSEEQTSELQSLMRIAYAVFCLK